MEEVGAGGAKRFAGWERRVFGRGVVEDGGAVFPGDVAGVEGEAAVGGGGIAENGHAGIADEDEALLFEGLKPTAEEVGFEAVAEVEAGEGGVGAQSAEGVVAGAGHGNWSATGEAEQHGDVVRGQAPERVFLSADFAEIQAMRMEAEQAAEATGAREFVEAGEGGVVFEQVVHLKNAAETGGGVHEVLTLGEVEGHGFFDEEIFAGV